MTALRAALAELWSLFVDDDALALMIVAVAVIASFLHAISPAGAGVVLVFGAIAALLFSVLRAAR